MLYEIQKSAILMKFELEKGNIDAFAKLLNEHWELSKRLDGGCTNTCIEQIFLSVDDMLDAKMKELSVKNKFALEVKGINSYQNSFELLTKDLKRWKKEKYRTVLLCSSRTRAKRLAVDLQNEELNAFLFSLGCYSGEPIKVISRQRKACTVSIKDGRYNIDAALAEAITVA